MEGYSHNEIAEKLDCVERTVERQVELIRKIWAKAAENAWENASDAK